MSDIVERLGFHREHPGTGQLMLANPDGPDAADQITRLTVENERLRAALSLAANRLLRCSVDHVNEPGKSYERAEWSAEARAALQEQTK